MVNAHYPGLEAFHEFGYGEGIIQDTVRLKLTQALGGLKATHETQLCNNSTDS
jgi:hypothetical protein